MDKYLSVIVHGVVVLVVAALTAPLFFSAEGDGVDIFAAMFATVLLVLGLPWSLPWFAVIAFETSMSIAVMTVLFVLFVPGGALLNVVLHYRRRRRRLQAAALGVQS